MGITPLKATDSAVAWDALLTEFLKELPARECDCRIKHLVNCIETLIDAKISEFAEAQAQKSDAQKWREIENRHIEALDVAQKAI